MSLGLLTRVKVRLRNEVVRWCGRNGIKPPAILLDDGETFARNVASRLSSTDVVIDLGAHVGVMSMEFARHAGKVYAFEPHPSAFKQLKKNTARMKNVVPINKAVSVETGTAQLFSVPTRYGRVTEGSSLSVDKTNISKDHVFEVETVSLAQFIESLDSEVKLIKMDIEGAEYDIIESLLDSNVIHKIGIVYVEDHCDRIPGLSTKRDASLARIRAMGVEEKFDFTWH